MGRFGTLFPHFRDKDLEQKLLNQLDRTNLPRHVAIIMDGNGRWAQKRGLPRTTGHKYGVEALRKIIKACVEYKIHLLTVYAFSTENWKRPKSEVSILMSLIVEYLRKELNELHRENVCIRPMGNIQDLPEEPRKELMKAAELTRENTTLIFNVALNYGGRREIVDAVREVAEKVKAKEIEPFEITEETLSSHLYTAGQPDPDLLIRPSGELRISNFLLWQLAYAEFYYTGVYWPDFNKLEFLKALVEFQKRNRRYGGI